MRTRITAGLLALAFGSIVLATGMVDRAVGQDKKDAKGPVTKFLYGHDLRVRPGGERDWDKAVKIGVEVFQDEASGSIIGITESGAIAAYPASPVGTDRACKWLTAHDLKVRKSGEPDFTQKTQAFGVEVFRDMASGKLLYASQSKSIAFANAPSDLSTSRGPKWRHGLVPKVREPNQDLFDSAKGIGLEVFTDENTNGLIYITEKGFIAATPPAVNAQFDPAKLVAAKPLYGLVLRVRAANEPDFTATTKKVPVEVFEDPNSGYLFYISDAGYVAVVPKPAAPIPPTVPDGKAVDWKSAMNLKARPAGKSDFKDATAYGIEVFQDRRTNYHIFLCHSGSIAVIAK